MIDSMEYLAFGIGLVFGASYLRFSGSTDWLLVILHYMFFRSKDSFYGLYDDADKESSYERMRISAPENMGSYAKYLKIHQEARPSAYKRFTRYYSSLTRFLLVRTLPILLIPAILFWSNWYFYIAGALVAVILLTLYVIIVKPNSAGARKQLLVLAILKSYLKDQKKTK